MPDDTNDRVKRPLEAPAVSVRLRRLWLGDMRCSPGLAASDFADSFLEVGLRREASTLVLRTPYDFGSGDPFEGGFGEYLRARASEVSGGVVDQVAWEYDATGPTLRRAKTSDLDIYSPGDPLLKEYPEVAERLRRRIPADASSAARAAVGALRLVGVSQHRLWFAVPTTAARDALGTTPGARAALVTAVQAVQKHELPLYRVVVDSSYRGKSALL